MIGSLLTLRPTPPILIVGRPGVGKRTAALLMAQASACDRDTACGTCPSCLAAASLQHPDVKLVAPIAVQRAARNDNSADELVGRLLAQYPDFALGSPHPTGDPRDRVGVHLIRWLRAEMVKPPVRARTKLVIILQAESLGPEGAAALLKALEEPRPYLNVVLTATRPTLVPDTIRSRCRTVRFADLAHDDIRRWSAENGAVAIDTRIERSLGSLGRASNDRIREADAASGRPTDHSAGSPRSIDPNQHVSPPFGQRPTPDAPDDAAAEDLLLENRSLLRADAGSPTPDATEPAHRLRAGRALLERLADTHLRTNIELAAAALASRLDRATRTTPSAFRRPAARP